MDKAQVTGLNAYHQYQEADVLSNDTSYWIQQLKDAPMILDLPTDRPHPQTSSLRRARSQFVLPQLLSTALKTLSGQEGVSLFISMLTAFEILLYRYSGQKELLVGIPTIEMGETQSSFTFDNVLVLRVGMEGNPSFRTLLRHVHQVVKDALDHREVPFEQVVQALQPDAEPSRHPLFQIMIVEDHVTQEEEKFDLLSRKFDDWIAKLDLTLFIQESLQTVNGGVEYNTDIFDDATIIRMMRQWQNLLESIATDPNQGIDNLSLLSRAEWQQQVIDWNATQTNYPQNHCYHTLFEAQAERSPEAVAVVCEQEKVTYRELNQRANQIAYYLQRAGVMPEVLVGLLIDRSIDFVVAILAVFKAGAAFLPLDPQHPAKRHYEILKQSHCHFILTSDKYEARLIEASVEFDREQRPQVLQIESLSQREASQENLPSRSKPGNLAYVMYTSGSTGVPKGVMVEQAGMVNHMYAKLADLGIHMGDKVAQNSSPCFDIVVWQCLAALLLGGSVHIFKDEIALNPLQLLQQTDEQNITILQLVPSLLRALVQEAELLGERRPHLKDLRWIVPTGDALSPELCRQWLRLYPEIPMLNNCGSTECSDDNCHYAIYQPPPLDYPLSIMPIGRPIRNIRAYILDHQLKPVPIKVEGDLYIGGIGVGRGYLNNVERTAELFIPDPFSQEPGARLYKTRDRARFLPDGLIEFLGRSDNLIKIRGLRIEPGEVEAILERHPAIREAVILARENIVGNKYLVGYVVPVKDHVPTNDELRAWLREKLPEYMIPTIFMILDAMPLNSNGKLDRRALPEPNQAPPELKSALVKARTPLEETIATIWSQVLQIGQVGIHDNFFELGGHSLLAMQVLSLLRTTQQMTVPLHSFLEAPTVAQLAELLQQSQTSIGKSRTPTIRSVSREAYRVSTVKNQ